MSMVTEQEHILSVDDLIWIRYGLHSAIAAQYMEEDWTQRNCMQKVYDKVDTIIHQIVLEEKMKEDKVDRTN
jgi:hypothetical protein